MKEQKKIGSKIQKLDPEDLSIISGAYVGPAGGDFGWDLTASLNPYSSTSLRLSYINTAQTNPYINYNAPALDIGSILKVGF